MCLRALGLACTGRALTTTICYVQYNDSHACNYGIWLGVFTWLLTMAFMVAEVMRDSLGAMRRTLVVAEVALSAIVALLWYD